MHTDEIGFSLLVSLPTIPNIFTPLLSGIIIDNIGCRWGLFIFAFVVFIGSALIAMGGFYESYTWVMIGTFVYCYGAESLLASNCIIKY